MPALKSPVLPGGPFSEGNDEYGIKAILPAYGRVLTFRWIPPGRFVSGDIDGTNRPMDCLNYLPAPDPITIESGFWLLDFPVTRSVWNDVLERPFPLRNLQGDFPARIGDRNDVDEFVSRLNHSLGTDMSLVDEYLWEYAARGGSETPFDPSIARIHKGNELDYSEAFCGLTIWDKPNRLYCAKEESVFGETYHPSNWGLYHMVGNGVELCANKITAYDGQTYSAIRSLDFDAPKEWAKPARRHFVSDPWGSGPATFRLMAHSQGEAMS